MTGDEWMKGARERLIED